MKLQLLLLPFPCPNTQRISVLPVAQQTSLGNNVDAVLTMSEMKDKRKHVKFVCSPIVNTPKPAKEEKKDDDPVDAAAAADGIDTEGPTDGAVDGAAEGAAEGDAGEKKDDMDVDEPEVDLSGKVDGEGDTTMEDA